VEHDKNTDRTPRQAPGSKSPAFGRLLEALFFCCSSSSRFLLFRVWRAGVLVDVLVCFSLIAIVSDAAETSFRSEGFVLEEAQAAV